jgi:ABC-type dipeptide/oligopeptide/nickel transport system permease component
MNYGYIVQRLLTAVIVLLGVTFAVFLIIHLVPGDPARVVLGVQANEENVAALHERMGLDRPFLVQYGYGTHSTVTLATASSLANPLRPRSCSDCLLPCSWR